MLKHTMLLVLAISLSGCAGSWMRPIQIDPPSQEDTIELPYVMAVGEVVDERVFEDNPRDPSVPSIRGGFDSIDEKTQWTIVGRERNGYGMAIGNVQLMGEKTIQQVVRDALTAYFEHNESPASAPAAEPTMVDVTVEDFWLWLTPGAASAGTEAQIALLLEFPEGEHDPMRVSGYGASRSFAASQRAMEQAYSRALEDLYDNLDSSLSQAGD